MAGNGGMSIRNIKNMIELCEKEIHNIQNNEGEDWHFSQAIVKYNYNIPPLEFRCKVIQENFPVDLIPIGTHQFWTYINNYNLSDRVLFTNHINKLITLSGL